MKTFYVFLFVSLFMASTLNAQFKWPNGKKAAVVFTYDDGLDCHLDVAVPQLDKFGFKGTFFCTGNSPSLYNRMEEWRGITENGHELGNHTLFHPCDGAKLDWVKPEYDLNNYTIEQIIAELKTANTLLKAVDPTAEQLIEFVEKARENGTIAVFMFHSVGGGYLNVGADEHRKLLEYIKANEKDYYTGTFLEVMQYIQKNQ